MSGSEAAEAISRVRAADREQAAGKRWSAQELSRLAMYVLTAGPDTPALRRLAVLGAGEEQEAQELFATIVAELG